MPALRRWLSVWVPVVAWCGVIFYFSDQPDLTIERVVPWWMTWLDYPLRKAAHVFEYAVLFLLARRGLGDRNAWLFCVAYAISDEWHQTVVPGRIGRVSDVVIDAAAAALPRFAPRVNNLFRRP